MNSAITRRDFLKIASLVGSSAILGGCISNLPDPAQRTPTPQAPNIILFLTDDQPPDTIAFMPTLQAELVEKGVSFVQSFATTPLCSPSRASVLTGQYAHHHGVLKNRYPDGGALALDDTQTIATWLQNAGYKTSFLGKYLNGYNDFESENYIPPGWDDWHVFVNSSSDHRFYYNYTLNENGSIVTYAEQPENYSNDVLAKKAVQFIQEMKNQAFFMVISFYAPHQPGTSAKRHNDLFKTDEQISPRRPPNFNEVDIGDKPVWMNTEPVNPHDMDKAYQKSLRTLMSVDEAIEQVLAAVREIRQEENTALIYFSDNSEAWGEHRLQEAKNCPYEACTKVPLVMKYPKIQQIARTENRIVGNIDLAPTIAELAEVQPGIAMDGMSLLPLLKNPAAESRDAILLEHWPTDEGHGSTIPQFFALRTAEWKYVVYETGEEELYDLINDPYELENRAGQVEFQEIKNRLEIELATQIQMIRE